MYFRKKESGQNNSVPFPSRYCRSRSTGWCDRCLPHSGRSVVERMGRGGGCCLESCQGTGNLPEEGLHAALEVTVRMVGGGQGQKNREREMRRESCRNEEREKWGREKKGKPTKGKRPWPKRTQRRQQRRGRTKVARERREEG